MKEVFLVSKVKVETIIIRRNVIKAAIVGEINHDNIIMPSFVHARFSNPVATIPATRRAPIAVCVPEIGIPNLTATMIKVKDAKQTANIICFYLFWVNESKSGIISLESVAAT